MKEQAMPKRSDESRMVYDYLFRLYEIGTISGKALDAVKGRLDVGLERYGQELRTHNGRDAMRDLREELLDAMAYAAQAMGEARDAGDEFTADILKGTASALSDLYEANE